MEGFGDDMIGVPWVGESDVLPPGQDFLLGPLVGLAEMVVNLHVDCTSMLVERKFRVGFKQVVKSKVKGVRNEKHHLMVLEDFALNSRMDCSCSVSGI
jgi:hypothetical protein